MAFTAPPRWPLGYSPDRNFDFVARIDKPGDRGSRLDLELGVFRAPEPYGNGPLDRASGNEPAPPIPYEHEQSINPGRVKAFAHAGPALVSAVGADGG